LLARLLALVMVVHGHRQRLLGAGLADDVLVQGVVDLARLGQVGTPGGGLFLQFLADDVVAELHALVANEHGRTRAQFAYFMLALAAKRAVKDLATLVGTALPLVAHAVFLT